MIQTWVRYQTNFTCFIIKSNLSLFPSNFKSPLLSKRILQISLNTGPLQHSTWAANESSLLTELAEFIEWIPDHKSGSEKHKSERKQKVLFPSSLDLLWLGYDFIWTQLSYHLLALLIIALLILIPSELKVIQMFYWIIKNDATDTFK